ncbi:hypothetical protein PS1_047488 [Malus domestica]
MTTVKTPMVAKKTTWSCLQQLLSSQFGILQIQDFRASYPEISDERWLGVERLARKMFFFIVFGREMFFFLVDNKGCPFVPPLFTSQYFNIYKDYS